MALSGRLLPNSTIGTQANISDRSEQNRIVDRTEQNKNDMIHSNNFGLGACGVHEGANWNMHVLRAFAKNARRKLDHVPCVECVGHGHRHRVSPRCGMRRSH